MAHLAQPVDRHDWNMVAERSQDGRAHGRVAHKFIAGVRGRLCCQPRNPRGRYEVWSHAPVDLRAVMEWLDRHGPGGRVDGARDGEDVLGDVVDWQPRRSVMSVRYRTEVGHAIHAVGQDPS